jgi:hypothetical protein
VRDSHTIAPDAQARAEGLLVADGEIRGVLSNPVDLESRRDSGVAAAWTADADLPVDPTAV